MKKFYLLAASALLVANTLSARELKFYDGDKEIPSGSKIVSTDFTVDDYGIKEVTFEPDLYIWSDIMTNTVSITAKCVSGQTIQFCAGGACVKDVEITKIITIKKNEKLPLRYDYIDYLKPEDEIPTVVTEISAYDTDHSDVKADFTIVMDASAGVGSVFANNSCFKAVNGGIQYDFEAPSAVALYNLAGEAVLETVLEGSGILNTSSLQNGVYVYKAGNHSGKIYLR